MTRQAVIDVGTNSVKFHLAQLRPDGSWTTLADRAVVSRLGEGIDETGAIAPAAMERTAEAIAGMVKQAKDQHAEQITAVGTMGLRSASNSQTFIDLVFEQTGTRIEVISGEDECRLAYLAARSASGLVDGSVVVFDTGGGSSQFTFGQGTHVDRQFSLNVGAVRFTEQFQLDRATSAATVDAATKAIAAALTELDGAKAPDGLVGMGGAITNITAIMLGMTQYEPDRVQGATIDRSEINRQIELFRPLPADRRRQVPGLQPARAEVILAGACIVGAIMDKLHRKSLTVSDRGLRHGVLISRFGGHLSRSPAPPA